MATPCEIKIYVILALKGPEKQHMATPCEIKI
jgi:hypothetical protein